MAIPEAETDQAVARRCLAVHQCVHPAMSQRAFAAWLGVTAPRWNHVVTGMPLSRDLAMTLVRKIPTITLDYLYRGRYAGMHPELIQRLSEAEARTA